jgi:hypothetical protein
MFLIDAENPGVRIARIVDAIDRSLPGGHAEVEFDDCRVADHAVLGGLARGSRTRRFASLRLASRTACRIYDGPTETHKWVIARHALRARGVHSNHPRGDGIALGA